MPYAFRYGPVSEGLEHTRFRLWAPSAERVILRIDGLTDRIMTRAPDGWHEAVAERGAGARYKFGIGDVAVPDPASRMQDRDVHDWSVVTDPSSYEWRQGDWKGRPWEETVLYELHPGLLGGFTGIQTHLERLATLGITAIELMPIADFPGERNWGYDGVLPFAPDRAYGTPDELKALVDAAHARGMMVFLDVVYNHFGPDGNYLGLYAPQFFDESKHTPWGAAINFSRSEVRRFFVENAIYWLDEFRFDGLRLDAVHAICDKSFLPELAREVRSAVGAARHIHLVVENDDNDASLLRDGYDAQWDDDLHHVLHVMLTGEKRGYYEDYANDPATKLARGLSEGFIYQDDSSPFRDGVRRGSSTQGLSLTAFVFFLQNHDQIGNRAFGERLITLTNSKALEAAVALQLLAPEIPLIFMGEEAGSREPFLYFTDHRDPKLAELVCEGRRREFSKFPEFDDEQARAKIPDPNGMDTFQRCIPHFADNTTSALYSELLQLRREHLVPHLRDTVSKGTAIIGPAAVLTHWRLGNDARLTIACNLGQQAVTAKLPHTKPVLGSVPGDILQPATTIVWIDRS